MPTSETRADGGEAFTVDAALFDLLGNDIRLRIVRELSVAGSDAPLSFSGLRERVGVEDSGRFNYHLDRLTGPLVCKRPDGYTLTPAGESLAMIVDVAPAPPTSGTDSRS